MINATIEAAVFAPPTGAPSASSVRNYVLVLSHWAEIVNGGHAVVLVSRSTQDVLILTKSFPMRPWLAEMLTRASVAEYDANTVARLVETLLSRTSILEDTVLITDLLFDSLTLNPNVFSAERHVDLRWEAEKAAVILAILNGHARDAQSQIHCLVTESNQFSGLVGVRCQISAIEHSRTDLPALPVPPAYFAGSTRVGNRFIDCVVALDETKVMQAATSIDDVGNAIRIALCKYRIANGQSNECLPLPNFRFNGHFFTCLRECGVFRNSSLAKSTLRAMVETIENLQLANVHKLRTGDGPNEPQVRRGNDLAWRRDIDHEYHLHYWQCAADVKELACVVHHEDVHICA